MTPYQEMKLMDRYGPNDLAAAMEADQRRRAERPGRDQMRLFGNGGRLQPEKPEVVHPPQMDPKPTGPIETEQERGEREDRERKAAREEAQKREEAAHGKDPLRGIRHIFGS